MLTRASPSNSNLDVLNVCNVLKNIYEQRIHKEGPILGCEAKPPTLMRRSPGGGMRLTFITYLLLLPQSH